MAGDLAGSAVIIETPGIVRRRPPAHGRHTCSNGESEVIVDGVPVAPAAFQFNS